MTPKPDHNDPFGPPKKPVQVYCLHCGETYPSIDIAWNADDELWVCKNYARCGGAGFGMDIFDVEQRDRMET